MGYVLGMIDFVFGAVFASFLRLIKKYKNITFAVVGILFVGCISWSLFVGKEWSVILVVGVGGWGITIWMYRKNKEKEYNDKKEEHKNWLLRNREAVLIELTDTIIDKFILHPGKYDANDMKEQMKLLLPAFFAHGSKDFLEAWFDFQNMSKDDLPEKFRKTEKLLRAIRKDLGCDDSEAPPGFILMTILQPAEREKLLEMFKDVKYD